MNRSRCALRDARALGGGCGLPAGVRRSQRALGASSAHVRARIEHGDGPPARAEAARAATCHPGRVAPSRPSLRALLACALTLLAACSRSSAAEVRPAATAAADTASDCTAPPAEAGTP